MIYILIIILVLALCAMGYISEKCLQMIVHPVRRSYEEMKEAEIRDGFQHVIEAYENGWDRNDFQIDRSGTIIRGEIITNPQPQGNKVAIICHGHTANRYACLKYGDLFYRRGYHLVIFDERYFGASDGSYCTLGEKESEDLAAIIGHARKTFPGCRIALHGESMGAATALLVLRYTDVDLVVADCPFADSERLFNEFIIRNLKMPPILVIPLMEVLAFLQYGYHIRKTSPIQAVRNTDVPICFMHGIEDTLIVCDHSKTMHEVCKNPLSQLHLFEHAKHAASIDTDPKGYDEIVGAFLQKCETE